MVKWQEKELTLNVNVGVWCNRQTYVETGQGNYIYKKTKEVEICYDYII